MDSESPKKQDFESDNFTLVEALNTEWSESEDDEVQDMINFRTSSIACLFEVMSVSSPASLI